MTSPIRPKQLARMGEFYLEEAVLDILLDARHEDECLGAAAIGKRAGIFREAGYAKNSGNDDIVWGILGKLVKEGRIQKCAQDPANSARRDGWEMTESEYQARRDDVS